MKISELPEPYYKLLVSRVKEQCNFQDTTLTVGEYLFSSTYGRNDISFSIVMSATEEGFNFWNRVAKASSVRELPSIIKLKPEILIL